MRQISEVVLSLAEERDQRQSNLTVSHIESTSNYSGRMVIVIEHVYMEVMRTKKVSFIMKAKPEGGRNISLK